MAKRKGQAMLDRVSKMAKASAALEEEKVVSFSPMVAESKEEYYDRVLKNSTNMDRVLEFLMFKREADKLLPNLRDELVKLLHKSINADVTDAGRDNKQR